MITRGLLLLISISCSFGSESIGQIWTGGYDPSLGTLPTNQGWQYIQDGAPSPPPIVASGVLQQGPTSFTGYQYWQRSDVIADFSSVSGQVIRADVKIKSSTYSPGGLAGTWRTGYTILSVDSFGRTMALGISDTGVRISVDGFLADSWSSPLIALDTTSTFRSYTMVGVNSVYKLFVDGAEIASLAFGPQIAEKNY
ncbi:MAG: hypothetical protein ACK58T_07465, partial [Phycisphaerae bacterium]